MKKIDKLIRKHFDELINLLLDKMHDSKIIEDAGNIRKGHKCLVGIAMEHAVNSLIIQHLQFDSFKSPIEADVGDLVVIINGKVYLIDVKITSTKNVNYGHWEKIAIKENPEKYRTGPYSPEYENYWHEHYTLVFQADEEFSIDSLKYNGIYPSGIQNIRDTKYPTPGKALEAFCVLDHMKGKI